MAQDFIEWFSFLSHPNADKATKRRIILRTGGVGYLGDLVKYAVRQRKHLEPAQTLKESNVPRDYVGNEKRWEWMHERDEEEVFGTPRMNIASRIKESAKRKQQRSLSYEEQ